MPVVPGIDEGILLHEIAVHVPAERAVFLQRGLIGLQVEPRLFHPKFPDELMVDQPMLGSDLCGSALGSTAGNAVRLHQRIVHPRLLQLPGAENPRNPSANDQDVCFQV